MVPLGGCIIGHVRDTEGCVLYEIFDDSAACGCIVIRSGPGKENITVVRSGKRGKIGDGIGHADIIFGKTAVLTRLLRKSKQSQGRLRPNRASSALSRLQASPVLSFPLQLNASQANKSTSSLLAGPSFYAF